LNLITYTSRSKWLNQHNNNNKQCLQSVCRFRFTHTYICIHMCGCYNCVLQQKYKNHTMGHFQKKKTIRVYYYIYNILCKLKTEYKNRISNNRLIWFCYSIVFIKFIQGRSVAQWYLQWKIMLIHFFDLILILIWYRWRYSK